MDVIVSIMTCIANGIQISQYVNPFHAKIFNLKINVAQDKIVSIMIWAIAKLVVNFISINITAIKIIVFGMIMNPNVHRVI